MSKGQSKYQNKSDEELLKSFESNPNAVLELLFQRYSTLCFGLALKIFGNREKAKDAVSDLFLKLKRDLCKYEIEHFKSWLYVYTRNHCFGVLRKESVVRKHEALWEENRDQSPYNYEKVDEKMDLLRDAIDELNNSQKRCIEAFYFEKKSYYQISQILQIPVKKVKSNLQNGRRKLRLIIDSLNRSNISTHD
ncbi:MAG TPA: sigma-70 family RNA polymerase sigma factor [Cryomorphaceae bacterium]|nr:sigma-70 family RNA polymerase sigma factor [Cryomorphaceae bacterium]